MELTKKSREVLYSRHIGNGCLFLRTSHNEITSIDFHLGRDGFFYAGDTELTKYLYRLRGEINEVSE